MEERDPRVTHPPSFFYKFEGLCSPHTTLLWLIGAFYPTPFAPVFPLGKGNRFPFPFNSIPPPPAKTFFFPVDLSGFFFPPELSPSFFFLGAVSFLPPSFKDRVPGQRQTPSTGLISLRCTASTGGELPGRIVLGFAFERGRLTPSLLPLIPSSQIRTPLSLLFFLIRLTPARWDCFPVLEFPFFSDLRQDTLEFCFLLLLASPCFCGRWPLRMVQPLASSRSPPLPTPLLFRFPIYLCFYFPRGSAFSWRETFPPKPRYSLGLSFFFPPPSRKQSLFFFPPLCMRFLPQDFLPVIEGKTWFGP